ncbi:MAG: phosphodiester glycosidase family protein [Bacilli bacterium]|nr:phosphodiester glycosidase family protein [Bacilli bacterium]
MMQSNLDIVDIEDQKIGDFDFDNKSKKKNKKKRSKLCIVLWIFVILGVIGSSTVLTLLYGPYDKFRNWLVTTAMTTMSHRYLATWFYGEDEINKILSNNRVIESGESTNTDLIKFVDYDSSNVIYKNKYEKELLTKDKDNNLYKLININEGSLRGYLVAIYDPSKVKIGVSKNLGSSGQMLTTIAKNNNAVIAMNASGFIDPEYNSNGGQPHGLVIKDGRVVSNNVAAPVGGGIIGFDKDNKLILGKISKDEALNRGIRDAIEFGPFLIVNGTPSFIRGNGGWGSAPRSAIAQRQDGIVLFLVMDGRDYKSGVLGADMVDMTEILQRYGAYNAANLDGGTSSGLVINNELINKPVNALGQSLTRAIPDAWIVVE